MHIGIAGAGVMGRVLAWQCQRAGMQVSLFDKDPIAPTLKQGQAAAFTAAGMLTPYCEVESAEMMVFELGMQSLALWQQIANELDNDIAYFQQGSLIVSHQQDMPDFHHFNQLVQQKLSPNHEQFRHLNQAQLTLLEPELADRFQQATYLPEEAWLCPRRTMQALASQLIDQQVQWHENCKIEQVKAHTIRTSNQDFHFDTVIDCRGMGAKPQWDELRGVRGELIWLEAPGVNIKRLVRLMHPRYSLYLVPKGYDDLYVIGATQIESNDDGPITVRSSLELLSAVYSLHDGFAEARIVETRTNCRPALNNNLPQILCENGLIRVNGLFRHGFLLSPSLGEEIVHYLNNPNYQSSHPHLMEAVA